MPNEDDSENFQFVETAAGLFHMQIAILALLFTTHMGTPSDISSLAKWIEVLGRDKNKMWDGQKSLVRDFRQALDYFDTILEGHILTALSKYCAPDVKDLEDFAIRCNKLPAETLINGINDLAKSLADFSQIARERAQPREARDIANENIRLLMQHGLVFRNFDHAIRRGDSGRALGSVSFFKMWFQDTNKTNYAVESLRLQACLKKVWSEQFQRFYMENCLINLSGKSQGFMACDMVNEYVVREVKDHMNPNSNSISEERIREKISLLVMHLREWRRNMAKNVGAKSSNDHSTKSSLARDYWRIGERLFRDDAFTKRLDRRDEEYDTVVKDLYVDGLIHLANGTRIAKLKHDMVEERDVEHLEDKAARLNQPEAEMSVEIETDGDEENDADEVDLLQLDYINDTVKAWLEEAISNHDW
jgi:hypothetical protein